MNSERHSERHDDAPRADQPRPTGDDLLARIADLPRPALDPRSDARIHDRARDAFLSAGNPAAAREESRRRRWAGLWRRALAPALVAGVVAGYLAWTASAMDAVARGRRAEPLSQGHRPLDGPASPREQ
jgi:hypothetical protein